MGFTEVTAPPPDDAPAPPEHVERGADGRSCVDERAAVVAYIREVASVNRGLAYSVEDGLSDDAFAFSDVYFRMNNLANAIERGDHLPKPSNTDDGDVG